MTKSEWESLKDTLLYGYCGIAELVIDGYRVTLIREPVSELKEAIFVYINGKSGFRAAFQETDESKEIQKRFFDKRIKCSVKISKKEFAKMSKQVQKEVVKMKERLTITYFESYWTSFDKMKRHLIANNQSIDLKSCQ